MWLRPGRPSIRHVLGSSVSPLKLSAVMAETEVKKDRNPDAEDGWCNGDPLGGDTHSELTRALWKLFDVHVLHRGRDSFLTKSHTGECV